MIQMSQSRMILQQFCRTLIILCIPILKFKASKNKIIQTTKEIQDPLMDLVTVSLQEVNLPLSQLSEKGQIGYDLNKRIDKIKEMNYQINQMQRNLKNSDENIQQKMIQISKLKNAKSDFLSHLDQASFKLESLISQRKNNTRNGNPQTELLEQVGKILQYIKSTVTKGQDLLDKLFSAILKIKNVDEVVDQEFQQLTDFSKSKNEFFLQVLQNQRSRIIMNSGDIQKQRDNPQNDTNKRENKNLESMINSIQNEMQSIQTLSEINLNDFDLGRIDQQIIQKENQLARAKENFDNYITKLKNQFSSIPEQEKKNIDSLISVFQYFQKIQGETFSWIKELIKQGYGHLPFQSNNNLQQSHRKLISSEKQVTDKLHQTEKPIQNFFQEQEQVLKSQQLPQQKKKTISSQEYRIKRQCVDEQIFKTKAMINSKTFCQLEDIASKKQFILNKVKNQFDYFKKESLDYLLRIEDIQIKVKQLAKKIVEVQIEDVQFLIEEENCLLYTEFNQMKQYYCKGDQLDCEKINKVIEKVETEINYEGFSQRKEILLLVQELMKYVENQEDQLQKNQLHQKDIVLVGDLIDRL